ncbi:MAG TPA: glycosyltransferase [Candidatus Saccharimonadia bacterium]
MIVLLTAALAVGLIAVFWRRLDWGVYALVAALPFERIGSWALQPDTGHPVVRASQVIGAALVVAFALQAALGRVRLYRLNAPLWLLAALVVSTGWSAFQLGYLQLINGWTALVIMSLLVFTLYTLARNNLINWNRLFTVLMLSASAVALFGLYQFVADSVGVSAQFTGLRPEYQHQVFGFPRIQATALEPLYFANYLLIPLLVGGAALLAGVRRRWLVPALALIGLAFGLTMSRGAFIGLAVALALGGGIAVMSPRVRRRLSGRGRALVVGGLALVVLSVANVSAASALTTGSFSHGPQRFVTEISTKLFVTPSYSERSDMRRVALQIFRSNPWWGVGVEGITPYLRGYTTERAPNDVVALNNQFYEVLAETGLMGATLFYAFLAVLLGAALWAWRRAQGLAAVWLMGLVLAVVAMTVQAQSFSGFLLTQFWVCYGLLAGLAAELPGRPRAGGPRHIVIDARMYGPARWTGIGRYLQNVIFELERLDHENQYTILLGDENYDEYTPSADNFRKLRAPFPIYSLGEQWGLWRLLRQLQPDLVHFASPNAPVLWSGPRITTVHDLTLLMYNTSRYTGWKQLISLVKRLVFRGVMWMSVTRSTLVLTPTKYVRRQIMERYGVRANQIMAAPNSVSGEIVKPGKIERFNLPSEYVVYVGNCYPYKNVGLILQALAKLQQRRPAWLALVVVGREDYFRTQLRQQAAALDLADRVIFTGQVTDEELAGLYRHAALYVYPSLSEGFGLQGLEAMSHGVPVLAANASCLPETCGEAARYFDPHDAEALANLIEEVLGDEAEQVRMKKAGTAWVQTFSWKRTAERTLEAYRQALD